MLLQRPLSPAVHAPYPQETVLPLGAGIPGADIALCSSAAAPEARCGLGPAQKKKKRQLEIRRAAYCQHM